MTNKKIFFYCIFLLPLFVLGCAVANGATPVAQSGGFPVADFETVTLNAPGVLEIIQGETEALEISGDPKLLSAIRAEVKDRNLVISAASAIPPNAFISYKLFVKKLNAVTLDSFSVVKAPSLTADDIEFTINGSGRIEVGALFAKKLKLALNGAGGFTANSVAANEVVLSSAGAGNVSIQSGNADKLNLKIGAGSFFGSDFKTSSAMVNVEGAGTALVWVAEKLNATINGTGKITYFGEPIMSMSVNGGGQLTSGGRK